MSYKVIYKASYTKEMFENYISKTILYKAFLWFWKGLFKTQNPICIMQIKALGQFI
jgi:hypothetical protein